MNIIPINNKCRIKINKHCFSIQYKRSNTWQSKIFYHNLECFLKDLPGNIIKNSKDIHSINDMKKLFDNYLDTTVPQLYKALKKNL